HRIELGEEFLDIVLAGRFTRLAAPFGRNAGLLQNLADMILFEDTHVAAHLFVGELNAVSGENCSHGSYRRQGTMVDHGSCPIKDHSFHAFHDSIPASVSAAMPNESVIPAPPGEVTIRTPGAGSSDTYGRSGCFAYTPYQRCAMRMIGARRK